MTPDQRLLASAAGWLAGVVLLAAAGAWAGYAWRDRGARADLAECQRVHAEALAVTLRAAQQAESEFRAREAHTTQLQTEALHAAHSETAAERAARDRTAAALERLRQRAAAATAARGGGPAAHPTAAAGSAPAAPAADLHPGLLDGLGAAARQLAESAEAARIAGRACERHYDALSTPRLGN